MTPYDYIVLAGVALLLTAMARCEPWPTLPLPPEGPMEDRENPIWWHHCAMCDAELEPGNEHTAIDGEDVCEIHCDQCRPA